jgi:tRNA (cmo5U34)-methyltransferase
MQETNEFDQKALAWDNNPMHFDRSAAIAQEMNRVLPLNAGMSALEFGAGTGILSFMLKDRLKDILMIDSSVEMINIANRKIEAAGIGNLKTMVFDLEKNTFDDSSFDLIFTQMVLHHVMDIEMIFRKFCNILKPGGYLAIADLFEEDGSFHGDGFSGHKGFNPQNLKAILERLNLDIISMQECFVIERKTSDGMIMKYPVFLITAKRNQNSVL